MDEKTIARIIIVAGYALLQQGLPSFVADPEGLEASLSLSSYSTNSLGLSFYLGGQKIELFKTVNENEHEVRYKGIEVANIKKKGSTQIDARDTRNNNQYYGVELRRGVISIGQYSFQLG